MQSPVKITKTRFKPSRL